MGSDARTSSDTSNVNNTSTNIRDIGFTGLNAQRVLQNLANSTVEINAQSIGALNNLVNQGANITQGGFDLARISQQNVLGITDNVLSNLTNATRDVTSRLVNAATNQPTPLASIPAAGSAASVDSKTLIYIAIAIAVVIAVK